MTKKKPEPLVEKSRSDRKFEGDLAKLGYAPGSVEATIYRQGYLEGRASALAEIEAAQPCKNGGLDGSDEDKALANEYGLDMGKTEDERWSAYRDYLRGLQKGRELQFEREDDEWGSADCGSCLKSGTNCGKHLL